MKKASHIGIDFEKSKVKSFTFNDKVSFTFGDLLEIELKNKEKCEGYLENVVFSTKYSKENSIRNCYIHIGLPIQSLNVSVGTKFMLNL